MAIFDNVDTFSKLENAISESGNNGEPDTINITGDIDITSKLPVVEEDVQLTINGGEHALSGESSRRILSVKSGNIILDSLTFSNGLAQGSSPGGGGGAGLGGALFIYDGDVVITNTDFESNQAVGGDGGTGGRGGDLGLPAGADISLTDGSAGAKGEDGMPSRNGSTSGLTSGGAGQPGGTPNTENSTGGTGGSGGFGGRGADSSGNGSSNQAGAGGAGGQGGTGGTGLVGGPGGPGGSGGRGGNNNSFDSGGTGGKGGDGGIGGTGAAGGIGGTGGTGGSGGQGGYYYAGPGGAGAGGQGGNAGFGGSGGAGGAGGVGARGSIGTRFNGLSGGAGGPGGMGGTSSFGGGGGRGGLGGRGGNLGNGYANRNESGGTGGLGGLGGNGSFGGGGGTGGSGGTGGNAGLKPGDGGNGNAGGLGGFGGGGGGGGGGGTGGVGSRRGVRFRGQPGNGGSGGEGGFGGGDADPGSRASNSSAGEIGAGGGGAGMGGAVFIRSGTLTLSSVQFKDSSTAGGTGAANGQGLGGAIFVLDRTTNGNGNDSGMPSSLPTVKAADVSFSGNNAGDASGNTGPNGVGENQNNNDVFGTITASSGSILIGTDGPNTLEGSNNDDVLIGGADDDTLTGKRGNDLLLAGSGNDILNGDDGDDILSGGSGINTLTGGLGNDIFEITLGEVATITDFGGIGRGAHISAETLAAVDTVKFTAAGLNVEIMQLAQVNADTVITFLGDATGTQVTLQNFALESFDNLLKATGANVNIDNGAFVDNALQDSFDVFNADSTQRRLWNRNTVTFLNDLDNRVRGFNDSDDVINGQGGDDTLIGLSGDDILRGGEGDDTLRGGQGDDILRGGLGDDRLMGGRGSDLFMLAADGGTDTIFDFAIGTDQIGLANGLSLGQLSFRDNQIRFEDEVLAVVRGVTTATLGEDSFTEV
jgi:hypothetical protein